MNMKKLCAILTCALLLAGCQSKTANSTEGSSSEKNTASSTETTSIVESADSSESQTTAETKAPATSVPKTEAETKVPVTSVPKTEAETKAPETTTTKFVTTAVTTPAPKWTETAAEKTMYINTDCYSRKEALLGAEQVKLYRVNEQVKVTATTDTGYCKIGEGEYIHSDYLSGKKVETTVETKAPETTAPTNYGTTNSGDKILGYNGDGYAIIGYTPDGDAYVGEGEDEFGEYWVITWFSDGEPMRQYKESKVDYGGADLNFE